MNSHLNEFKEYIVFIETSDVSARYLGEATRRMGYEPLFLFDPRNYQGDTLRQLKEFAYLETPTENINDLAITLSEKEYRVALITTFLDSRIPIAAELAQMLGVPGLPSLLTSLKDKYEVLEYYPELFPESLKFNRLSPNINALKDLLNKNGKIILKPRFTAGGVGLQIISTEEELEQSLQQIQLFESAAHLKADEWMAQAFRPGQLCSLEGFVQDGNVHFWGASGRRKIGNTESIAVQSHESGPG